MTNETNPEAEQAFKQYRDSKAMEIGRSIDEQLPPTMKYRELFPKEYIFPVSRNDVLEEVAKEIEKMTAFGQDTVASFAIYIRNMKT
jgi:hypothetical protein